MFLLFYLIGCKKNPTNADIIPIPSKMTQQHISWPSLVDSPWPMYRHDPQGTGRSQYSGPSLGQLKWKFASESSVASGNGFTSTAIGSDGTLYIPSSYEKHNGFGQVWNFYALNPDGTIKWSWFDSLDVNIYEEFSKNPLITADGTIILCSMGTPESYVYALDSDGSQKWKYFVEHQPSDPNIGLDGIIYFTTEDGLYALTQEGDLNWKLNSSTDFNPSSSSGLAVSADGQILYIGGYEGHSLYAVSNSGNFMWSYPYDQSSSGIYHMPMVDNQNNVYFITASGLTSLSPEGETRWTYECQSHSEKMVMDKNGYIFIHNTTELQHPSKHEITALNYAGQKLWGVDCHYVVSGIVMDNDGIIYLVGINEVSAISSSDGTKTWELYLGYSYQSWYTPALDNGVLYFGIAAGEDNKFLYAIN